MVFKKTTNEVVSLFRQAASYASPSAGELVFENDQILTVHSRWSQRDIERKEKTTLQRCHIIDLNKGKTVSQTGPQEVNELFNKPSPSGNYRAVLRSGKDKKNDDKQYVEIYDRTKKSRTIDILAFEKHGKILKDDDQFGGFEWSRSEKQLLYVAEKKRPKTASFFDAKSQKGEGGDKKDVKEDEVKRGCENEYYENWGEMMTDIHHPVICVLDLDTSVVTVLDSVDGNLSPGQAVWAPDNEGVVFCAWDHEPYRLGLRHCSQRKGGLFYLNIQTGVVERLSDGGRSARFPRFSPNMSRLVYLDTPVGGGHHQCSRLVAIDWATKKSRVVVDIVKHAPASSFQGIFTAAVPRNVWFEDNVHLALTTAWRSQTTVVIINTNNGTVKRLPIDENKKSMSLLTVEKSCMLLSSSSLTIPFHLIVAKVKDLDSATIQWIFPDRTPETLNSLSSWEVLHHKPTADRVSALNGDLDYESIFCMPHTEHGRLPPLIVFSHGGPHVGFDTSYSVIANFYCLCGFAVLMINYRGSWGFGQDCIDCLHGRVGDMDVKDVQSAMMSVLSKEVVDSDKILVTGGSHGGFLTTHLIGQYPTTFKAAATRNPVTNLISMFSTTDIKDWIFVEGGYPFDMASLIDDTMFSGLWKRSPISHIDNVKTPVLLMVGLEDKRVPPTQAMEYYKALKARNIPVRCLTYPSSNHSLSEVDVEGDCMVNTIMWFYNYI